MTRIGLISCAHESAFQYASSIRNLDGAELVGLYDDDRGRAHHAAMELEVPAFDDIRVLLDLGIEATIIASETIHRRRFTEAAAHAGVHVLCQEPIASTLEDAQAMVEVCQYAGVHLMIASACRFAPPVYRAMQVVKGGTLGRILGIKGTDHAVIPGKWMTNRDLAGGGAVMMHGVRLVDLYRWMLEQEVVSVYSEIDTLFYRDLDVEDTGVLLLDFSGGTFASLEVSWSLPPSSFPCKNFITMEIVGDQGSLTLDLFRQRICLYKNQPRGEEWIYWGDDMHGGLLKSFLRVVREGISPSVPGEEGLKALEVVLAAQESARIGFSVALNSRRR